MPRRRRKHNRDNPKFTPEQREKLRELYEAGVPEEDAANQLGLELRHVNFSYQARRLNAVLPRCKKTQAKENHYSKHEANFRIYLSSVDLELASFYSPREEMRLKCKQGHTLFSNAKYPPRCSRCPVQPKESFLAYMNSLHLPTEPHEKFDFYYPQLKLAVKFVDLYQYSTANPDYFRKQLFNVAKYCKENGIRLFGVPRPEWEKSPEIVRAWLERELGVAPTIPIDAKQIKKVWTNANRSAKSIRDKVRIKAFVAAHDFHSNKQIRARSDLMLIYGNELVGVIRLGVRTNGVDKIEVICVNPKYRIINPQELFKRMPPGVHFYKEERLCIYDDLFAGWVFTKRVDRPQATDGKVLLDDCRRPKNEFKGKYKTTREQLQHGLFSAKYFGDDRPMAVHYGFGLSRLRKP
jgi:hypothetical protein